MVLQCCGIYPGYIQLAMTKMKMAMYLVLITHPGAVVRSLGLRQDRDR